MSTNKLEHYSKLLRLYTQAKPRLLCHVGEPIKLANVMGVTISASVQLFISSFLTHFLILMRWQSSSRIRTVGCVIVCRIPSYAGCQHPTRGRTMKEERFGGLSLCTRLHPSLTLPQAPPPSHSRTSDGCHYNLHAFLQLGSLFNTLYVIGACF